MPDRLRPRNRTGSHGPSADPAAEQCGWLVDKFGLSWQIVPAAMGELLSGGGDPEKAQRAMAAMLQMKKLNIAALRDA